MGIELFDVRTDYLNDNFFTVIHITKNNAHIRWHSINEYPNGYIKKKSKLVTRCNSLEEADEYLKDYPKRNNSAD